MPGGDDPLQSARTALESALLGEERRYTRRQIAAAAGVSLDWATRLWRALGFPEVGDDEAAFTDQDLAALGSAAELVRLGLVDEDLAVTVTRSVGQTMSGLADWQVNGIAARLLQEAASGERDIDLPGLIPTLMPSLQQLMDYAWRRHLVDAAARLGEPTGTTDTRRLTVGFADIVDFSRLVRGMDEEALNDLVDRFEGGAADLVTERHGRVVKTLGDEVMFVSDDPTAAADIALALAERHAADRELPDVRVGLAVGEVLTRLGDVYGAVVNIASRLTGLARPNSVLVDRDLAEQLDGGGFVLKELRTRSVPGYRHLQPYVLRRAAAAG